MGHQIPLGRAACLRSSRCQRSSWMTARGLRSRPKGCVWRHIRAMHCPSGTYSAQRRPEAHLASSQGSPSWTIGRQLGGHLLRSQANPVRQPHILQVSPSSQKTGSSRSRSGPGVMQRLGSAGPAHAPQPQSYVEVHGVFTGMHSVGRVSQLRTRGLSSVPGGQAECRSTGADAGAQRSSTQTKPSAQRTIPRTRTTRTATRTTPAPHRPPGSPRSPPPASRSLPAGASPSTR